jgi:hypothetical protein
MNNLTKNQENLIEQIKKEFLAMNESETPKSFADLLLMEIDNSREEMGLVKVKSYALFEELQAQYERDVDYIRTECAKLGIGIVCERLYYKDDFHLCNGSIKLLHPTNRDYNFYVSVAVETRLHSKSGFKVYELCNSLQYSVDINHDFNRMYSFNTFVNSDSFKERVTTLYHRINN